MKIKSFYIYIAAYLAILIPTPGRFVYGITLMTELALLMLIGIFVNLLIDKIKVTEFRTVILMFVLISFTVLYRQIFVLLQPELALTLGFTFYLPTLSLFLIGFLLDNEETNLRENIFRFLHEIGFFIVGGLFFFLFRDVLGFGTFTFFGPKHQIYEKVLLDANKTGVFTFFATIPGALFLESVILYINFLIKQKFKVIRNAEAQK